MSDYYPKNIGANEKYDPYDEKRAWLGGDVKGMLYKITDITGREGGGKRYKEYKGNKNICKNCPTLDKCTNSKVYQKTVTRHVWQDYIERAEDIRHSPPGKESYSLRSQTIERVFADAKEKYSMRYTQYRGLEQVSNWVTIKYAAMNLKKTGVMEG